jgi:hypothetical protein
VIFITEASFFRAKWESPVRMQRPNISPEHRQAVFEETLALLRRADPELPDTVLVELAHTQTEFRLFTEQLRAPMPAFSRVDVTLDGYRLMALLRVDTSEPRQPLSWQLSADGVEIANILATADDRRDDVEASLCEAWRRRQGAARRA